jgi:uncharacterized cupredoxin-like copper-binding protein
VVVGSSRRVAVAISEYSLRPTAITVTAGVVTFVIRNDGLLVHNFVVQHGTRPLDNPAPNLFPGQRTTLAIALAPGRYTLLSNLASDSQLGLHASLVVTPR